MLIFEKCYDHPKNTTNRSIPTNQDSFMQLKSSERRLNDDTYINKIMGDKDNNIIPESERNIIVPVLKRNLDKDYKRIRFDRFQSRIVQGSKNHRICFKDQIAQEGSMNQVFIIEKNTNLSSNNKDKCCSIQ